jgi:hypothetical protein
MDYDYNRYCEILQNLMEVAWIDRDNLEIGEDISDIPAVKIIFDGHGDLEDEDENGEYRYTERGNKNMESYAIFIHKDSGTEDFVFPEHDVFQFTFGGMIQHRPAEEVCIYAWYDVIADDWEFLQLEDRLDDDCEMTAEDVMNILETLQDRWFNPSQANWPFPGTRPE